MSDRRSYKNPCGVARSLDAIGERWALLVVRDLLLGPKRFNDLLAGLPGISSNVLSQRLRELTENGVVQRRELGAPTRVNLYELTDWGRGLEPILLQLGRWGNHAPLPAEGELGIDSLLLGVKASFDPAQAKELRGRYELRIDGDNYLLEVRENLLTISRLTTLEKLDAVLSTDLKTLLALYNQQLTVEEAIRAGGCKLEGDPSAQRKLTELLLATSPNG